MDEFRRFFAEGGKPIRIRGPATGGLCFSSNEMVTTDRRMEHRTTALLSGTDYADEVKQRQVEDFMKNETERENWKSVPSGLQSLDHLSSFNIAELTEEAMRQVYEKYSFQVKEDVSKLCIYDFKEKILDHIQVNQVVIIEGPTGCGKTTQVPQWIIDDCYKKRKHCQIVVTQPRRIAAISIAKRVAQERGWDVGGVVGYQVGLENKTTNDTRIRYVTTGVLLQKLVNTKNLNEYTHIIIDEVHERGQDMDFLLLVIKKLLFSTPPGVKLILMSATFNYEEFADYFAMPTAKGSEKADWIQIVKRPTFMVKTFYLNHLHKFGSVLQKALPKGVEPGVPTDMYRLVIKLISMFEGIDQEEDNGSEEEGEVPSVLVFLPGINEIEELYTLLNDIKLRIELCGKESAYYKWYVLPLHSTITADEQTKVFQPAPPGNRKIILSTNIAESSITVPDIKYVVDFCLMKILVANEQTNFTSLQLKWASKTNCEQRAGRVGRVRDGRVYRLVTDKFYCMLPEECEPEIKRCPLERLVLLAKMLEMGPPKDILALAMDPPDLSNIHMTVLVLKEIGALKNTHKEDMSRADGDLTYLGRVMARLPLDVRASKLIILGHIFGYLHDTVIMAAAMSVKELFSNPFRERLAAYNSKLTWADGSTSDCLAFLNVYKVWTHLRKQKFFNQRNEGAWARSFFVQVRALRELDELVRELQQRLKREGIQPPPDAAPRPRGEQSLLLKVLIAGAFYPHYFVQSAGDESREREAVKTLGSRDPRTTVYLQDFPHDQPRELYAASIRQAVLQATADEPRVSFDANSAKVFLTFDEANQPIEKKRDSGGDPTIPGRVVLPVYKAIKMRQLQMAIRVPLLPPERASQLAEALQASRVAVSKDLMVPRLPEIDDTHIPIKISQFVNCGRFWAQYDDDSTATDLQMIHDTLNKRPLLAYTRTVSPGDLVAAPYQDETGVAMFRARVKKILPGNLVLVFYLDYGSAGRVAAGSLRELPAGPARALPPLAMDCSLAQVMPSRLLGAHGEWTPEATRRFTELKNQGRLLAKVYSVAYGVVALELLAGGGRTSVNKDLVQRGLAQLADEGFESKMNHDLRETATEMCLAQKRGLNKQQTEDAFQELREAAPPAPRDCAYDVKLKGPFSPLETSVSSLMYVNAGKRACIEWHSCNAVLLDTEPQEVYQRMLVAAVVGTDEKGSKLTLRHTTLMPYIPGLPAIISLLFCPVAELRRDGGQTRYGSALCGLGGGAAGGAPVFPEHDLRVEIDADFDVDDVRYVNHIRHLMDYMLYIPDGQEAPSGDQERRAQVPALIREDLIKLLGKRRKHREPPMIPKAWEWGMVPEEDLLERDSATPAERIVAFPMHKLPFLRPITREQLRALKDENDALITKIARTPLSSSTEASCQLCGTDLMAPQAMRIHLQSRAHKEKEEDFRIFDS